MDLERFTRQLERTAGAVRALLQGVPDHQARWKPDPESWSLLEVVNHLYDEEREDFRVRLDFILHRPGESAPPIDPQGWVSARRYNQRELQPSLDSFLSTRQASLKWLGELGSPDWEAAYEAPFGRIRAGDMLAAWVAHDLLHLRQLVELYRAYTVAEADPYRVDYAGDW